MTWAQLDDHWDEHPKYGTLGLEHFGLMACAITYSNRLLTDGIVPARAVHRFGIGDVRAANRAASYLVSMGIWEAVAGGYRIVGYLDHNPSKEWVTARKAELFEKRSAAGKAGGIAKAKKMKEADEASKALASCQGGALANPGPLLSDSDSPPTPTPETESATVAPSATVPPVAPASKARRKRGVSPKVPMPDGWAPRAETVAGLRARLGIDPMPAAARMARWAKNNPSKRFVDWDDRFIDWAEKDAEDGKLPAWDPPPVIEPESTEPKIPMPAHVASAMADMLDEMATEQTPLFLRPVAQ